MFDVVIIGAGVTGSAIAREVSRYKLNTCVIEKEEDVCNETSKANSAIIHAGFDAVPGTMKAKLNVMGNAMMDTIAEELDIPFKRNGSLVVCTKEQDPEGLQVLMERGKKNGVPGLQILDREALIKKEPNLADDVIMCTVGSNRRNRLSIPYDNGICGKCIRERCSVFPEYES